MKTYKPLGEFNKENPQMQIIWLLISWNLTKFDPNFCFLYMY